MANGTDILVLPLGNGETKPWGFPCGKTRKTNTLNFASHQGNKNSFWHTMLNTVNFIT